MSGWRTDGAAACGHAASLPVEVSPATACEDCLREGTRWVHLRRCLGCQHVGCCNSSPMRHATAHWRATGHPVAASAERGEQWAWCFPDDVTLLPAG
jgi:hypothetical protein